MLCITKKSPCIFLTQLQLILLFSFIVFIIGKDIQPAIHPHKNNEARYELINKFLNKYNRPFTMLDIEAGQGYYSLRGAFEYPASVFVILERMNKRCNSVKPQQLALSKAHHSLNNIILLNTDLTIPYAKRLSECEHFDVVLALNVIHRFGGKWKEITDIILNMGSNIIIETPPQEAIISEKNNSTRHEIEQYLLNKKALILGQIPQHTSATMSNLYLLSPNKNFLERKTWLTPLLTEKTHIIEADFIQKKMYKKGIYSNDTFEKNDWIPGINLLTFKMCHGIYPTPKMLKKLLSGIRDESHNDWMINNMILQGCKLRLIDFNDPMLNERKSNNARLVVFNKHVKLMDIANPIEVELYFWNDLVGNPSEIIH